MPPLAAAVVSIVFTPLAAVPSRLPLGSLMERLGPPHANRRTRQVLATSLVGSSVLIVSVTLVLQAGDALERQELSTVNQRFEVRGSQGVPQNQVLVAIDDYTFTLPPKPTWPFDRQDHADVINNLVKAGAKVIAYDVQFTEEGADPGVRPGARGRRRGGDGKIILATTEVRSDGSTEIFGGGEGLDLDQGRARLLRLPAGRRQQGPSPAARPVRADVVRHRRRAPVHRA